MKWGGDLGPQRPDLGLGERRAGGLQLGGAELGADPAGGLLDGAHERGVGPQPGDRERAELALAHQQGRGDHVPAARVVVHAADPGPARTARGSGGLAAGPGAVPGEAAVLVVDRHAVRPEQRGQGRGGRRGGFDAEPARERGGGLGDFVQRPVALVRRVRSQTAVAAQQGDDGPDGQHHERRGRERGERQQPGGCRHASRLGDTAHGGRTRTVRRRVVTARRVVPSARRAGARIDPPGL